MNLVNKNGIECLLKETDFTNLLQSIVEYGNRHVLKNFEFHLEMDCENEKETLS